MRSKTLRGSLLIAAVALSGIAGASCSKKQEPPPPPRTPEQQRKIDSTIGASKLPGAKGVQGALRVSDSAAARKAAIDSMMKAP